MRPLETARCARLKAFLPTLALMLVSASVPARAGEKLPHPGLYVGLFAGYNAVLGDWDLAESEVNDIAPDGSFIGGLRLGVQLTHWLGIEIGLGIVPFSAEAATDLSGVAFSWRGDVLVSPLDLTWSPHVLVGAGAYQLASGDLGQDADWDVHWGLGVRGMLSDFMNVRAEVRHVLTDSFSGGLASNLELTVGVDFWLWDGGTPPAPPDRDRDGIPDRDDECPAEVGVETARGCPDSDRDGVADARDACPEVPGSAALRGCPDRDGDEVPDNVDKCVDTPGFAEYEGCPPPPPDVDGDGTPDAEDACPTDPGPRHAAGCPDQDGDGIVDALDKCPTQPGVPQEKGCLPRVIQRKFSGSVKGINFETGSAQIKKGSFGLLDEAVKVFTKYPFLRIAIAGHTDDEGADDMNMELSRARAEAVRAYLVDKGIATGRLTAEGFGETMPIGNNKTAGGRAKNRRIEFKILGAN